tara:strand:+ start:174 stop:368 length:195 start_codon:yes stop_codon:yes gene_type:complete
MEVSPSDESTMIKESYLVRSDSGLLLAAKRRAGVKDYIQVCYQSPLVNGDSIKRFDCFTDGCDK